MILTQSQPGLSWTESILHADYWLLLKINRSWQHPVLDDLALFAREALVHVPVYLFLAIFMLLNFGRKGLWWILAALTLAGLSDFLSAHVIKEIFDRPRPCRDPVMAHHIRMLAQRCGMNGSFISSHASNHFAAATFIHGTLRPMGRIWRIFFLWAAFIAYSQVYVGVHYPSDVICGAIFGCILGYLALAVYKPRFSSENQHT
jgi:undecaprenyl-diphosphatase